MNFQTYQTAIRVHEPFKVKDNAPASARQVNCIIDELIDMLVHEAGTTPGVKGRNDKRRQLQSLLTVRPPLPLTDRFLVNMDRLQKWESAQTLLVDGDLLPRISDTMPGSRYDAADTCALWQGDITALRTDAIVNAANAELLGCFRPFHACIDNAIHSIAGPRLRQDCHRIRQLQGHLEKTGRAKITRGYHLPATYVLHTVGPVYAGLEFQTEQTRQLAACYKSCLDLGARIPSVKTIAFCSISTGVFGFPADLAARTALKTVAEWMARHPHRMNVIFNVFFDSDYAVYQEIISGWNR